MKSKQLIVASTILVMKITALQVLFLAVSAFSLSAKDSLAQNILEKRITLNVKNESVQQVITLIKQQTNVDFHFSASSIKAQRKMTCNVTNKTLLDFFNEELSIINIGYRIVNDQVVLFHNNKENEFDPNNSKIVKELGVTVADIEISGYVYDEKGVPLQGVTIREKGAQSATSTNEKGFFRLKVKSANAILSISSVGYTPQEVVASSEKALIIALAATPNSLQDVIVVGYGTQKKINNTGAISTITTKELVQSPVANISNSLVGRLPGLFATQGGGEPGNDASRIRIRGAGTFSGNTDPLVLVD
ncbi:MAG: carboxypeptidase-like regulatory domain-containing protein, partial [Chitinophagaceae bacterium]|nr:carboxypeptidase-like regulatory domain-containing protein [Chitinophagaceae bacterium]